MALKDDVLREVERHEERLFQDLDGLAVRLGVDYSAVQRVLEDEHESDLADKYFNWLEEAG